MISSSNFLGANDDEIVDHANDEPLEGKSQKNL